MANITIVLSHYWGSQYLTHDFLTERETIYIFVVYFVSRGLKCDCYSFKEKCTVFIQPSVHTLNCVCVCVCVCVVIPVHFTWHSKILYIYMTSIKLIYFFRNKQLRFRDVSRVDSGSGRRRVSLLRKKSPKRTKAKNQHHVIWIVAIIFTRYMKKFF